MRQVDAVGPLGKAALAQTVGAAVILACAQGWPDLWRMPLGMAALQGGVAALVARLLKAPAWWLLIHIVFLPLAVLADRLNLPSGGYLGAFLLLLSMYWRVGATRVPLYLSHRSVAAALAAALPPQACRVIDLGCGPAGLLRHLAQRRPDCRFVGVEYAPLPWLWARLACRRLDNCQIRYGDFWQQPLDGFDVAYAFLAPLPMTDLWAKARGEMPAGSLFISNSFPVPGQAAEKIVTLAGRRAARLYCYRLGG